MFNKLRFRENLPRAKHTRKVKMHLVRAAGLSHHKKQQQHWTWIPRRENTPDGKCGYFLPQRSKNPDLGFPAGRIHQTESAGISHLKTVKTLMLDSPQGDYTRRKRASIAEMLNMFKNMLKFPNFTILKLKYWNMHRSIFHRSKHPDLGKSRFKKYIPVTLIS